MFGNLELADVIATHCQSIDILCRQELRAGILVSERDYVTALSCRIRDKFSGLGINCHSQTLIPRLEQENGVDGIIIFKSGTQAKVGLFEAKRPQVTVEDYKWDYLTSKGLSHFSTQIRTQHKWLGKIALWEMFFNEAAVGFKSPPYDYIGSSCVSHQTAYKFMQDQGLIFQPWTTDELKILLKGQCINFYQIIYSIISCDSGLKFEVEKKENKVIITSRYDPFDTLNNVFLDFPYSPSVGGYFITPDMLRNFRFYSLEIPLPSDENQNEEQIRQFMITNRLSSYTFIDMGETK
jgi:hypothetical protein